MIDALMAVIAIGGEMGGKGLMKVVILMGVRGGDFMKNLEVYQILAGHALIFAEHL